MDEFVDLRRAKRAFEKVPAIEPKGTVSGCELYQSGSS
jgi:hypothetical protein